MGSITNQFYTEQNTFGKVTLGMGTAFAVIAGVVIVAAAILALPYAPLAGIITLAGVTVVHLTLGGSALSLIAISSLILSCLFGDSTKHVPIIREIDKVPNTINEEAFAALQKENAEMKDKLNQDEAFIKEAIDWKEKFEKAQTTITLLQQEVLKKV